jgi:hypothetical protein
MSGFAGVSTAIDDISGTLTDISNDTTNISTDTSNISTDTGNISTDTGDISTDTALILSDTTDILADTTAILAALNTIVPYNDVNDYDNFAVSIDLITDSYDGYSQARRILVLDAGVGTKVLEVITGAAETRTLTVTTGDDFPATNFTDITDNTTVAKLRVWW